MKKVVAIHIALLMITGFCYSSPVSEEFLVDMAGMKKRIEEGSSLKAKITVTNKSISGFIPNISAELRREGSKVYYKVMHLEYLFVPGKSYMVDHKSKTISYSIYDNSKVVKFDRLMPNMDSVLSVYDSVVYKGMVFGKRKYCIYSAASIIKYTELYFDPITSFVSKLVYQYNPEHIDEDATLIVEYTDVDFNPMFRKDEFSESRFVSVSGGNRSPVSTYYGYRVERAITDFDKY